MTFETESTEVYIRIPENEHGFVCTIQQPGQPGVSTFFAFDVETPAPLPAEEALVKRAPVKKLES
jgi:hypothetical protein